jgi:hypothetical protein
MTSFDGMQMLDAIRSALLADYFRRKWGSSLGSWQLELHDELAADVVVVKKTAFVRGPVACKNLVVGPVGNPGFFVVDGDVTCENMLLREDACMYVSGALSVRGFLCGDSADSVLDVFGPMRAHAMASGWTNLHHPDRLCDAVSGNVSSKVPNQHKQGVKFPKLAPEYFLIDDVIDWRRWEELDEDERLAETPWDKYRYARVDHAKCRARLEQGLAVTREPELLPTPA